MAKRKKAGIGTKGDGFETRKGPHKKSQLRFQKGSQAHRGEGESQESRAPRRRKDKGQEAGKQTACKASGPEES